MEKQNVTLSLPQKLLQKFKLLAVRRGRSMSGLMTEMIAEVVATEEGYQAAGRRHMHVLERGFDLGTQGKTRWSREQLHER